MNPASKVKVFGRHALPSIYLQISISTLKLSLVQVETRIMQGQTDSNIRKPMIVSDNAEGENVAVTANESGRQISAGREEEKLCA